MVWRASEREYSEYEEKKKAETAKQTGQKSPTGQNIKLHGKPYHPPGKIPANQQAQRDIRNKARVEQDTFANRHPTANRVVQGLKKAGHAAKEAGNRYVSAREESHRRLSRATEEEREEQYGTWVSPARRSSLPPKKKSKSTKKPSRSSRVGNDNYNVSLFNSLTGRSYSDGGIFGVGSSLPRKSTNLTHKKKKKATTTRRRRY